MFFDRSKRTVEKILIVEDEPLVAFDTEHMLMQHGYAVVDTVDSYEGAEAVLDVEIPDLIVADIGLSGERDGMEVARLARERSVPLLFVSGLCPGEAKDLAIGCLAKPYAQRDLLLALRAIDRMLRGKAPRRLPAGLTLYELS